MFERREVFLNPCFLTCSAIFVLGFCVFVPLSIKGVIAIPTHCSEFRLDDPYISWPHYREQVNHNKEMAGFGALTFCILILFSAVRPTKIGQVVLNIGNRLWYILDVRVFRLFFTGYHILLGYLVILIFVGFVKHTAGELRPCFLEVCQPNMTLIEEMRLLKPGRILFDKSICTYSRSMDYFCMSFFSGHTVTAFYAATICILLLHYMDTPETQRLFSVRFIVQCLILSLATWVAMTRMQDHYHHTVDVAVGIIVGISVAVLIIRIPLMYFAEDMLGKKSGEIGPLINS